MGQYAIAVLTLPQLNIPARAGRGSRTPRPGPGWLLLW